MLNQRSPGRLSPLFDSPPSPLSRAVRNSKRVNAALSVIAITTIVAFIVFLCWAIFDTRFHSSFTQSFTSPALVDDSEIGQLVSKTVTLYPNVVTLNPQVDCYKGRYLVIDAIYHDGLGSTLASYNALLNYAIEHRLTIVRFLFKARHIDSEGATNFENSEVIHMARDRKLQLNNWHASREQWEDCPSDSPVKTRQRVFPTIGFGPENIIYPNLTHAMGFHGEIESSIDAAINPTQMNETGLGVTVRIQEWNGYASDVWSTSLIYAVRNHISPPLALKTQPVPKLSTMPVDAIQVGVHIRLGDLGIFNTTLNEFQTYHNFENRIIAANVFSDVLKTFIAAFPNDLIDRIHFTIFSEAPNGDVSNLLPWVAPLTKYSYSYFTSKDAVDGLRSMASQHIMILALSDYSRSMCMFNVDQLKINVATTFDARWFGCHNHWDYDIDRNHTDKFKDHEYKEIWDLLPAAMVNSMQSLHQPTQEQLKNLTMKIREAASRPVGSIVPSAYEIDWKVYHQRQWEQREQRLAAAANKTTKASAATVTTKIIRRRRTAV